MYVLPFIRCRGGLRGVSQLISMLRSLPLPLLLVWLALARGGPTRTHAEWMDYALLLAERGRLTAPPNPWVGCVLVASDGSTILAQGIPPYPPPYPPSPPSPRPPTPSPTPLPQGFHPPPLP